MTVITAFRIVHNEYATGTTILNGVEIPSAFSGFGAKQYGGRWNNKGRPVVYLAASQAQAMLEVVVHLESERQLQNFSLYEVKFDENLVSVLPTDIWPKDWKNDPAPSSTKQLGDEWADRQESLILQVPSTIVSDEPNYIINPFHSDLHMLDFSDPVHYPIDPRIKK